MILPLMLFVAVGVLRGPIGMAEAQVEPPDSAAAHPYVAAMRSDLRNLVVAQEAYFADNIAYAPSVPAMGGPYVPSQGVTVVILTLSRTGWNGVVIHESAPGYVCGVFIGVDDAATLYDEAVEAR
jgi:hypothetical protein